VSSGDKIDIELFHKVCYNVVIEHVADSSFALAPVLMLALLGVSPKHVAEQPLVGDIGGSLYHLEVSVVVEFLTEPAMHAQDLVVDQSCNW